MRNIASFRVVGRAAIALAASVVALSAVAPAQAQTRSRAVTPEQQLLGVRLGRPYLEVIRRFGAPSELQTVALAQPTEQLPGLGGGAGGELGMGGGMMGGMPGMGGGNGPGMGASPFGGGGNAPAMGGGAMGGGSPFGAGTLAPPAGFGGGGGAMGGMAEGGMPGANGPGAPGGGMMGGMPGGGGGAAGPEYSTAILWVYNRPGGARLEFLINEDGRVAQISVASPAKKPYSAATQRGVSLGASFTRVMEVYGNPERHRLLPGARFYEAYYSKNYHAAFTFDTRENLKVVRITIALAD